MDFKVGSQERKESLHWNGSTVSMVVPWRRRGNSGGMGLPQCNPGDSSVPLRTWQSYSRFDAQGNHQDRANVTMGCD